MANLADLMVRLGVDADDLTSGFESAVSAVEDNLGKIGLSTAAAGAALEGFARGQEDTNDSLTRLSFQTGMTTDSLREMGVGFSDTHNDAGDLIVGMEELTKRGVDTEAALAAVTPEVSTFATVTGKDMADAVDTAHQLLLPFGDSVADTGDNVDQLARLVTQTDVPLGSLTRNLGRVPEELQGLGFSLDDAAAGVQVFRDRGHEGRESVREFRRAVAESEGDMGSFLDILGLSADEWAEYQSAVEPQAGLALEMGDAMNENRTAMQQLQQWTANLATEYGWLADAASTLALPLIMLGPALKGVFTAVSLMRSGIVTVIPAIWAKVTALGMWAGAVVAQGARAVGSLIVTAAQFTVQFAIMAAQATINGIRIAAVWTAQIIASAARGAAAMAVNAARVVASWVLMGVQSLIQAARMAAAWVIAMGPIGWIITAIVGLVAIVIANWDTIKEWTINIWQTVSDWVSTKFDEIVQWVTDGVTSAANWVRDGFNNAKNWAINIWNSIVTYIRGIPGRILAGLAAIGNLASRFAGWINSARVAVVNRFMAIVSWVGGIPGRILGALGDLGSLLVGQGRAIIDGFLNGLKATWGKVTDFVGGIASWIADNKGPISYDRKLLIPAGNAIMDGLNEGLQDEMGELGTTLDDITWMLENGIDPDMGDIRGPSVSGIESRAEFGGGSRGQGDPVQINVTVNESSNAAETGRLVVSKIRHQLKAQGVDIGEISFA